MDQRIANIYKDILNKGLVPYQYLYQRIKTKLTGRTEFVLRKPDGRNFLFHYHRQDEMIYDLDGIHQPNCAVITLVRVIPNRINLCRITLKWCIRYVWKTVKDFVKIGA